MKTTTTTAAAAPAPKYPTPADVLRALQGPDALAVLEKAARWAITFKESKPNGPEGKPSITTETAARLRVQELDDLKSETARRFLDALAEGKTADKITGEPLTGSRMLNRAALAAVNKIVRMYYQRPTAARVVKTDDGDELTEIDIWADIRADETPGPEATAAARAHAAAAVEAVPAKYRETAPAVAALMAAGYTGNEIAARVGVSPRTVDSIRKALRETPATLAAAEKETERRNAARREADGLRQYEESTRRAYRAEAVRLAAATEAPTPAAGPLYDRSTGAALPTYYTPEEAAALAAAK